MGKSKGRNEKNFCTELYRSARTIRPVFWHKIVDSGYRNPFDIVCCCKRNFYAIEAKISKNKISIPLVDLFRDRQHEIAALKQVRQAGGKAWILINVFNPHKWNYVLAMDPTQYEWLVASVAPKKSIKLDDPIIKREILHLEKSDGVWNLKPLII